MEPISIIIGLFIGLIIWGFILRAIFNVETKTRHIKAQTELLYLLVAKENEEQAADVLYRNDLLKRPRKESKE